MWHVRILVSQPGIKFMHPAVGAWILNYWTTTEVPGLILLRKFWISPLSMMVAAGFL